MLSARNRNNNNNSNSGSATAGKAVLHRQSSSSLQRSSTQRGNNSNNSSNVNINTSNGWIRGWLMPGLYLIGVIVLAFSTSSMLFSSDQTILTAISNNKNENKDPTARLLNEMQRNNNEKREEDPLSGTTRSESSSSSPVDPAKPSESEPGSIPKTRVNRNINWTTFEWPEKDELKQMLRSLLQQRATFIQHYPSNADLMDVNGLINHTNRLPDNTSKIDMEWHWYNFSKTSASSSAAASTRPPQRKLIIVQHTGYDDYYYNMTDISSITNMAYAQKHHIDYVRLNGVYYGKNHNGPEATYNKIFILKTLYEANQRAKKEYQESQQQQQSQSQPPVLIDAVLLLDSDALIVDLDENPLHLLPETTLMAGQKVRSKDDPYTHNVNAGVMLWNLQHDHLMKVVHKWEKICLDKIKKDQGVSDQRPLQKVLREAYTPQQRRDWGILVALNTTHFKYSSGTFVRHLMRQKRPKNWATQKSIAYFLPKKDRVRRLTKEVLKVCYYEWPGECVLKSTSKSTPQLQGQVQ